MLETFIAWGLTLAVCAFCVEAQVREDKRKNRIEETKAKKLKYWLSKCSAARELDK